MFERKKIGEDFEKLREERGVPKERIAAIIGISPEAVSRFEKGEFCLRTENILKLLDFYELPTSTIDKYYHRSERMQMEIDAYEGYLKSKKR